MSDKLNKTSSGAALTSVANHQASISGTGNDDPVLYMTNTWSYDFRLNDILIAPTFDKFIPSIGDRKIYKLAQLDMEKYCCATYDEKVAMISTVVALSKKQEPPAR
mgnify:CR=1 FL=1